MPWKMKHKSRYVRIILPVLGLVSSGCWMQAPQATASVPRPDHGEAEERYCSIDWHVAISCGLFSITVSPLIDGDGIEFSQRERVPENFWEARFPASPGTVPGVYWQETSFKSSFWVKFITSRHGNELYVCGHPYTHGDREAWDESQLLVERWDIRAALGSPFTSRARASEAIGQPAKLSVLRAHLQGGLYTMPDQRAAPTVTRTFVARFDFPVDDIRVDPQGRYMLVLSSSHGAMYRKDLSDLELPAQVILDSAQYPELQRARSIYMGRLVKDGIKRYIVTCKDGTRLMLGDGNNDGDMDQVESYSGAAFDTAGLYSPQVWVENYRSYSIVDLF